MTRSTSNLQYEYLAQLAGDQPGAVIEADDGRSRAILINPNGWRLTLTPAEVFFHRPDGAWATMSRPKPKKLERLVCAFSRGNSMGIPWQERR